MISKTIGNVNIDKLPIVCKAADISFCELDIKYSGGGQANVTVVDTAESLVKVFVDMISKHIED